jgi:hypothetical protein
MITVCIVLPDLRDNSENKDGRRERFSVLNSNRFDRSCFFAIHYIISFWLSRKFLKMFGILEYSVVMSDGSTELGGLMA